MDKVKDLRTNFSDVELELIVEYSNLHKGSLTSTNGFILMKSDVINSSFKVKSCDDKRTVKVCHNVFGNYSVYNCAYPSILKTNLGL
jgi:hypothetical protein